MKPLVIAAIWLMLFGVWPLANPGHALGAGFIVHYWLTYRATKETP